MTPDLQSLADDFLSSQKFLLSPLDCKEDAPMLLHAFSGSCAQTGGDLTIVTLENILLNRLARFDFPLSAKRQVPSLLREFFAWCATSGAWPPARTWIGWLSALEKRYLDKFRDDGSVKGETFKKNYTDVNRNDPCPCGSGKKFKKCCMGILG
jgi:hypothetical protein